METYQLKEKQSWHLETLSQMMNSAVAGAVLADLAENDPRIVVLSADLAYSNRTIDFAHRHPDRFYNFGIAEQNMVSIAAGMATTGLIPYVGTFASFLGLLCCEQIRTDLAYPNLPVRMLSHHAGISMGYYGTSHHATEDIGIMRAIANMKIVCPADGNSLKAALSQTVDMEGPIYFRIGRGRDPEVYPEDNEWEFGKIGLLQNGDDGLIIANGIMVAAALEAADKLTDEGLKLAVADLHTVKPLDRKGIIKLASGQSVIFVAEEHNAYTGVASAIADLLIDEGMGQTELVRIGFPSEEYAAIAPPTHLYRHYGLDGKGVAAVVRGRLKSEWE